MTELEAAVAALKQDPTKPVRAKVGSLTVELRAIPENMEEASAADVLAAIGAWEGESTEQLLEMLSVNRRGNNPIKPACFGSVE